MSIEVARCYDSHAHWPMTGEARQVWRIDKLTSERAIQSLAVPFSAWRGDWILGAGWDQNLWPDKKLPTRKSLDERWPQTPVVLKRVDYHALWVNGEVLRRLQIPEETGLLRDQGMDAVLKSLPKYTDSQRKSHLLDGQLDFLRGGFTHVRDMTSNLSLWNLARDLEDEQQLKIYVETCFFHPGERGYERSVEEMITARDEIQKGRTSRHLRLGSVKIFVDGALGSEGAYLSEKYGGSDKRGSLLMSPEEIEKAITFVWRNDFGIAVHAIGDEAADVVADAALRVCAKGLKGKLEIEHAELVRPETVEKMSKLRAVCHMQPCHWLSDHNWFDLKIPKLKKFVFPWRALLENGVRVHFGSDSPIESPSLVRSIEALRRSARSGVAGVDWQKHQLHSYPDSVFGQDSWTLLDEQDALQVFSDGRILDVTDE